MQIFGRFGSWLRAQPYWLQGSILAGLLCVGLFAFYILLYFPLAIRQGMLDDRFVWLPLITGHLYILFSGFFLSGGGGFCPAVVPTCVEWRVDTGCVHQVMTATPLCARFVEYFGPILAATMLVLLYMLVGALIGFLVGKYRDSKFHA
jgi:hypothetical protein